MRGSSCSDALSAMAPKRRDISFIVCQQQRRRDWAVGVPGGEGGREGGALNVQIYTVRTVIATTDFRMQAN